MRTGGTANRVRRLRATKSKVKSNIKKTQDESNRWCLEQNCETVLDNTALLSWCSMSIIHCVCEMRPPPSGMRKSTVAKRRSSISIQLFLLVFGSASLVASCSSTMQPTSSLTVPSLPKPHGQGEDRRNAGAASPTRKSSAMPRRACIVRVIIIVSLPMGGLCSQLCSGTGMILTSSQWQQELG